MDVFGLSRVFLPVGFMSGIIGRFFHQFGVTVAAAVLISMFVSFTLDPMLSSDLARIPALHAGGTRHLARLLAFFERSVERLARFYRQLLGWSLRHRITTLSVAAATFFGSLSQPLVGTEFVPLPISTTQIGLNTPVGTSLEATADKVRQVEAALASYPEVRYSYATINSGNAQGKNNALITVRLKERALNAPRRAGIEPGVPHALAALLDRGDRSVCPTACRVHQGRAVQLRATT